MIHRRRRPSAVLGMSAVLSILVTTAIAVVAPVAHASHPSARCDEITVPVSIEAGQPAQYHIWGELCVPAHHATSTVQVLLSGLNYSHVYWDLPLKSGRYSYVRWANRAGYATFNLDRIGIGHSSHPPSGEVTLQSNAFTVHQVVTALRTGATGHTFSQVALVGHSFGSEVAKLEASVYRDVDALVLTGIAHHISPSTKALLAQLGQPAQEVPRLAALVPPGDNGYLTVQDAQRAAAMYHVPNADRRVIALDIATKATNTLGELRTIRDAMAPAVTAELSVPILLLNGAEDLLVCAPDATDCSSADTLKAAEQPYYPSTTLDTIVVPRAGHAVNLHRNAHFVYRKIISWIDRNLCA